MELLYTGKTKDVFKLENGNYSYEYTYVPRFDTEDYIFMMDDTTLERKWDMLYSEFVDWIGSFEF